MQARPGVCLVQPALCVQYSRQLYCLKCSTTFRPTIGKARNSLANTDLSTLSTAGQPLW